MKVFVSYKYTGLQKKEVYKFLDIIKDSFQSLDIQTSIYDVDCVEQDCTPKQLVDEVVGYMSDVQAVVIILHYSDKSEGLLIESGIAYGLGIPIKIFVHNTIKESHYMLYGLTQDIVYYDDYQDLQDKILLAYSN